MAELNLGMLNMQIPDTLILCGGLGERLRPLTDNHQKCMLSVQGRPFLEYTVDKIKQLELNPPIFCCGHKADEVINHFGNGYKFSYRADINTGARIKEALNLIQSDNFIVFNGDSYCNIDYNYFWYIYKEFVNFGKDVCKILVHKNNSIFASYIHSSVYDYYGAGIYFFKKSYVESLENDDNLSIEDDIIPNCKNIYNCAIPEEFFTIDIGTKENYEMVNSKENKYGRFFSNLNHESVK